MSAWEISVVPWPTYHEQTGAPFWTVRVTHETRQRGAGSYRLTWSQRERRWVQNTELGAAMAKSSAAVTAARDAVLRALGGIQ